MRIHAVKQNPSDQRQRYLHNPPHMSTPDLWIWMDNSGNRFLPLPSVLYKIEFVCLQLPFQSPIKHDFCVVSDRQSDIHTAVSASCQTRFHSARMYRQTLQSPRFESFFPNIINETWSGVYLLCIVHLLFEEEYFRGKCFGTYRWMCDNKLFSE